MPTVIHQLADAFLRRKEAAQRKSVFPEDSFMPKSSKQDLANRLSVFEQGGTTELLKQAGKEMYENPIVNTAIGLTPGAGDLQSAFEAMKSAKEGDWTGAGLNAVGILPFVPALKTVWHGSPHTFDKFDLSKIGTGEGAQAYGHGLYLAESPDVAGTYKKPFSSEMLWRDLDAALPDALKGKAPDWADKILSGEKVDDLGSSLKLPWQKTLLQQNKDKIQKVIDAHNAQGNLYKVDLPDEHIAKMLDWDKPLSEQSEHIQKAWNKFLASKAGQAADRSNQGWISQMKGQFANPTGADMYKAMSEGHVLYGKAKPYQKVQEEVSNKLYKQGIPGVQYLDQASRGAGEGTQNFVVFSDELPTILERNAQPIK